MEQRVSLITLGVEDLERSRRFYVDGLGWTPGYDSSEVVFFQAGPLIIALYAIESLEADARIPVGRGSGGFALAHNVPSKEDVDAILRQAQAAGATLTNPAADKSWGGYAGYFADLDGHLWEIAWNPGFTFTPEGGVLLGP